MNSSGTFLGRYRINDRVLTDMVGVFLTDYEVSLRDAKKTMFAAESLHLHPVSPKMFSYIGNVEQMRQGVSYSISGTNLGAFTYGPLGHPGDGEYDHRPVGNFIVKAKFTRKELFISFEGITDVGRSGFRDRPEPLEPWQFEIRFVVPRSEMVAFLQIDPSPSKYFNERVDAC
jgi:hypothetical protein